MAAQLLQDAKAAVQQDMRPANETREQEGCSEARAQGQTVVQKKEQERMESPEMTPGGQPKRKCQRLSLPYTSDYTATIEPSDSGKHQSRNSVNSKSQHADAGADVALPCVVCRLPYSLQDMCSHARGGWWCKFCTRVYSRAYKYHSNLQDPSVKFCVDWLRLAYKNESMLDNNLRAKLLPSDNERQQFEAVVAGTAAGLTQRSPQTQRSKQLQALGERFKDKVHDCSLCRMSRQGSEFVMSEVSRGHWCCKFCAALRKRVELLTSSGKLDRSNGTSYKLLRKVFEGSVVWDEATRKLVLRIPEHFARFDEIVASYPAEIPTPTPQRSRRSRSRSRGTRSNPDHADVHAVNTAMHDREALKIIAPSNNSTSCRDPHFKYEAVSDAPLDGVYLALGQQQPPYQGCGASPSPPHALLCNEGNNNSACTGDTDADGDVDADDAVDAPYPPTQGCSLPPQLPTGLHSSHTALEAPDTSLTNPAMHGSAEAWGFLHLPMHVANAGKTTLAQCLRGTDAEAQAEGPSDTEKGGSGGGLGGGFIYDPQGMAAPPPSASAFSAGESMRDASQESIPEHVLHKIREVMEKHEYSVFRVLPGGLDQMLEEAASGKQFLYFSGPPEVPKMVVVEKICS